MKKFLICLMALILCFAVISCGGEKNDDGDVGKTDGTETVKFDTAGNLADYRLVRSDSGSEAQKSLAVTLRKAIGEVLGKSPELGTDYGGGKAKEILIGATKRTESQNALQGLSYYDYVVKQDGDKIVIVGGSDDSLEIAVNYFIENCIASDATLKIPAGDGLVYKHKLTIENLSIDGVAVKDFLVYNNSVLTDEETADFIGKLKKDVVGSDVSFANKSVYSIDDGGHYIILDGGNLVPSEYSITVENGNLVIRGSHDSLPLAINEFFGNYLGGFDKTTYNITSADNKSYETEKKTIPYTKDQLMTLLEDVYESDSLILGEQVAGTKPDSISGGVNRFYEATGEYQSILGIDLACYGIDLTKTSDAQWSAFICDIVDYCSEGGILTASSHWENPSGNHPGDRCRGNLGFDDTLEGYENAFEDLLTEGTEYNTFWKKELETDARFLKALGDAGVPVIWRPLHEANGGWFWFCTTQNGKTLDSSYIKRMWVYVYEYYEELGLDNLLWSFGPNNSSNVDDNPGTTMSPWYLYPGDEYVDMVGLDWYSEGRLEITNNDVYQKLIDNTGKIGSITEFGPSGMLLEREYSDGTTQGDLFSAMDLYGTLIELQKDYEYKFSYLLTWTSIWSIVNMTRGDELMETDLALTRAEVLEMFNAMN